MAEGVGERRRRVRTILKIRPKVGKWELALNMFGFGSQGPETATFFKHMLDMGPNIIEKREQFQKQMNGDGPKSRRERTQ